MLASSRSAPCSIATSNTSCATTINLAALDCIDLFGTVSSAVFLVLGSGGAFSLGGFLILPLGVFELLFLCNFFISALSVHSLVPYPQS